jgi:cytochrome c556
MKSVTLLAAIAAAAILAACGGETSAAANHGDDALPNGMTVKQQIETRQKNLKELGGAMKKAGDQMKSGAPSLDEIRPAVQTIKTHAAEIGTWFPAGTGPESGIETEALPKIWEDQAGFQAAAQKLGEEANKLSDVATGDDLAAIGAQVGLVGGACKNCHDNFRQKKKD